MAEGPRNSSVSGEVGDEATSGAALIATFYGPRDNERIRALHERFYGQLGPKPRDGEVPGVWSNLDETTGLCFAPPGRGAHDAAAVQLGMNAPGDAADAWEGLRRKLEGILDAGDLDGIWGYTLVYQAVVKEGYDAEAVLKQVLPAARRLHSAGDLAPIRTFEVAGGWACLLGVPDPVGGPDAGMVYAALASERGEDDLLKQFYSNSARSAAKLLPPDLIAHKGYYQMRQYRGGDLESSYEERLEDLQGSTDRLLDDLRDGGASPDKLNKLFRLYSRLLSAISSLKNLQVKVLQQSDNLDIWRSQFGDNEALKFHQDHLNIAIRELESKVEPLQFDLEIADKAVSAARLQLDKEQEEKRLEAEKEEDRERQEQEERRRKEEKEEARNQQLIQTLLAVVAAALALPQLIDKDLTGWLIGRIPILESFEGNTFAEFVVQLVLIAILAIPIWLGVRWLLKRWRESHVSEGAKRHVSEGE